MRLRLSQVNRFKSSVLPQSLRICKYWSIVLGPLLLLLTLSSNLTWHENKGPRLKHATDGPDLLQGQVVFEESR